MCKWRERDWDKEEENNWGKEEKKSLGGGRKNSWVPAVPKSMDMEGVGFLEIVMKETANQAEHPAFLPESRLVFLAKKRNSHCPTAVKAPCHQQGTPSAWLTATLMQLPRRDATGNACKAFYCRQALPSSSLMLKCWPAPHPPSAQLWRGLRHAWKK